MAFYDSTWYCNFGNGTSTGYYAVTVRPQNTAVAAGVVRRQFTAPAVGSERCFVCIVAGTTANVTDATWVLTRGAKTTDGTATWQECTGASAVNGDLTNTPNWTTAKATGAPTLGAIIKRNNGASYQICTTAGALGASEPSFSDTAGVTTTDSSAVWTSLGVVGNFTGGQAPHARLGNAFATNWFASGNTVYVGDNHAETGAIPSLNPSSALMAKTLCHNHSGSYPPASSDITTGATLTSSGSISITGLGSFYFYGLSFKSNVPANFLLGAGSVTQVQNWYYFDNCIFDGGSGAGGMNIGGGIGGSSAWSIIVLNNTQVRLGAAGAYLWPYNTRLVWQNTGQILASGSSVPTALFQIGSTAGRVNYILLVGLDLSQLTGSLFSNVATPCIGDLIVEDCKLNASTTVTAPGNSGMTVQLIRCDSSTAAYKSERYAYEGTETTETSITRVGGAQDPTGQAQSRKIVTSANTQWLRPFMAEPYAIWNATTGATVTVTVYGTINAGAVPNNDDIWLELEYLGSSAAPLGTIVTTTKASLLAANAAVSSDGSSWNGGGSGAGWSPFKLTTTLSSPQPGLAGYIDVRVRAAKLSTTYYLDPKVELT